MTMPLPTSFARWIPRLALALGLAGQAAETIKITEYAAPTQKPIPIALAGYSGEVEQVLRFDLYVVGFTVVEEATAQYTLRGANGEQVEGRLTDNLSKAIKFAKTYRGGTLRSQAHALADDVVEAVTGQKGIARTKIAFKLTQGQNSEIYVADYDGFGAQAVTRDGTVVAAPSWVPGQRKLYYVTYKFGNADIVWHDLNTGTRQIFARYAGSNITPAVSPDGRRVAMILSKGGSPDLYVADADGSNLRQLTHTREDESSPTWSPDGRTICVATRIGGRRMLATIPASGGTLKPLTIVGISNPSEPDWSPDGKWIAFTAQMRDFEICVVPASGGEAKLYAAGEDPTWAPNSRTLMFTRRVNGRRVLSLLDVPTKQLKDVARLSGNCSQPAWAR
jgi:TolB protein